MCHTARRDPILLARTEPQSIFMPQTMVISPELLGVNSITTGSLSGDEGRTLSDGNTTSVPQVLSVV